MFVSLFSVSSFCSLKEHIFQETPFSACFQMEPCDTENNTWEFKLCPMFKHSPNRKSMVYGPNGIYPQQKRHYGSNRISPYRL